MDKIQHKHSLSKYPSIADEDGYYPLPDYQKRDYQLVNNTSIDVVFLPSNANSYKNAENYLYLRVAAESPTSNLRIGFTNGANPTFPVTVNTELHYQLIIWRGVLYVEFVISPRGGGIAVKKTGAVTIAVTELR